MTYVRIAISAPPSGAFWSKKQLGHPDFSIVGVSLFPSYHGATLPGVDRRGVVSNTLAPLAGVFLLERHIRRVRVWACHIMETTAPANANTDNTASNRRTIVAAR